MNNKIMISIIVATFALGTIGCGSSGSGSKKEKVDDNKTPPSDKPKDQPKVIERDIKSEFAMPTSDLETRDYVKDLKISKNNQTDDIYVTFTHNDKGKRIQFCIDTDNDLTTGSTGYTGADIMVTGHQVKENGAWKLTKKLWRPDSNNTLEWKEDINATNDIEYNAGAKQDSVWLKPNLIPNEYFTVMAIATDGDNWTEKLNTGRMAFDIKMVDSGNPKTITGTGISTGLNIEIDSNTTDLGIKLIGNKYTARTQILIDADNDKATGQIGQNSHWENLGAEYLISEGSLYKWSNNDWDWDHGTNLASVKKSNSINYALKRSDLEDLNGGNISVGVGVVVYNLNQDWTVAHSIPDINASAADHTRALD